MATPKKRPHVRRPPRASWIVSQLPACLSGAARKDLIEANRHFDVDPRLNELDERLRIIVAPAVLGLDQSHHDRRAQIAQLREVSRHLKELWEGLHPRSRQLLWGTLAWLREPAASHDLMRALPAALAVLDRVSRWALDDIPRNPGPANQGRRTAVIRVVHAWLASLESNGKSGLRLLQRDELPARQARSVNIVCTALGLTLGADVPAIIARALRK